MAEPSFPLYPKDCRSTVLSVAIGASATKSSAFETSLWRVGSIYLPAEFNTDAITFEGGDSESGTFATLLTAAAASVGFTAAAGPRWYDLPAQVLSVPWAKLVTGTSTAGAATILVAFKT